MEGHEEDKKSKERGIGRRVNWRGRREGGELEREIQEEGAQRRVFKGRKVEVSELGIQKKGTGTKE